MLISYKYYHIISYNNNITHTLQSNRHTNSYREINIRILIISAYIDEVYSKQDV